MSALARIREKLRARRGGSLRGLLVAGATWIRATIAARVWLRACDEVGPDTKTFGRPHVENRGRMRVGARVRLSSEWIPLELVTGPKGLLEIEDRVFLNYGTLVSAQAHVRIGAGAMVGNHCIIADTDTPGIGEPPGGPAAAPLPVEIGAGAWLAARVTVLPGARIGAGAVIAAGSVVAGEIPPGVVAGGIPARVLRASAEKAEAARPAGGGAP